MTSLVRSTTSDAFTAFTAFTGLVILPDFRNPIRRSGIDSLPTLPSD